MKRVLMICYTFPPCGSVGSLRSFAFARHLSGFGWQPTVLTVRRQYILQGGMDSAVAALDGRCHIVRTPSFEPLLLLRARRNRNKDQGHARPLEVDEPAFRRVRVSPLRRLIELGRLPDEHVGWIPFAVREAWRRRSEWDVLYTTLGPPSCFVAGLIVKRLTGKPWLADFRDPWTWHGETVFPSSAHRVLFMRLERSGLARANAVVGVTPSVTELMMKCWPGQPQKFHTIYNGFDQEDIASAAVAEPPPRQPLRLIHAGTLYRGRSPMVLLEAIRRMVQGQQVHAGDIVVELIGKGSGDIEQTARCMGVGEYVRVGGLVSRDQSLQRVQQSHVGLVCTGGLVDRVSMPTKMFEYLAFGKPVLVIGHPEGEAGRFVLDNHFGWVVSPEDPDSAAILLSSMLRDSRTVIDACNVSPESIGQFNRQVLTGRLAALLDAIGGDLTR